jgi:uncharacterized membrane protein YgcG
MKILRAGILGVTLALAPIYAGEAAATGPAAADGRSPSDPAAHKPSLDISSQVDRSEITIGDQMHYEIKVVYPAKGRIELPSVLGNLGAFEVKDYQASEPKPAGTLQIQTWSFTLSTFTVGKYMIPPQQVVFVPEGAAKGNDSVTAPDTASPAGSAGGGGGGGGWGGGGGGGGGRARARPSRHRRSRTAPRPRRAPASAGGSWGRGWSRRRAYRPPSHG